MIKNEKSKSNFFNISPNYLLQNELSTNTTNKTGNLKSSFNKISNKELNITNFIKQKNKFFISNIFDEKESQKFMESKDAALEEIKLNDNIENIKNTGDKPNNSPQLKKAGYKSQKSLKPRISKGQDIFFSLFTSFLLIKKLSPIFSHLFKSKFLFKKSFAIFSES